MERQRKWVDIEEWSSQLYGDSVTSLPKNGLHSVFLVGPIAL